MWIHVKHRNLTLFAAMACVLAGAFGLGEEPDERIFRNRSSHNRARSARGCQSQIHQVLDCIHEEILVASLGQSRPGGDPDFASVVPVSPNRAALVAIDRIRDSADPQTHPAGFARMAPGRAPPVRIPQTNL